jgi:hypothetical protein
MTARRAPKREDDAVIAAWPVDATRLADPVVLALGGQAHAALSHELEGRVAELRVVGDAVSPRRIPDAILDGTRAARAL